MKVAWLRLANLFLTILVWGLMHELLSQRMGWEDLVYWGTYFLGCLVIIFVFVMIRLRVHISRNRDKE